MIAALFRVSRITILLVVAWFNANSQKPDWIRTTEFPNPVQGNILAKRIVNAPGGGIYMLVQYFGTITLAGTTISSPANTLDDGLLIRFSSDGDLLWYKQIFESEGWYSNRLLDLKVDSDHNLIFSGSSLWPTKVLGSSTSGVGQFIAKADANGNLFWVDFPPLSGGAIAEHDVSRRGNRIGFTPDGDILWFTDRINESAPSGGLAVLKYKPDGTKVSTMYVTRAPSYYRPNMQDFSVDAEGNFVISGTFESTVAFPGGPFLSNYGENTNPVQFFLAKFSPNGILQWVVYSSLARALVFSHTVDDEGNVFAGLQLGDGVVVTTPSGPRSFSGTQRYLAKISKTGELLWTRPMLETVAEDIFQAPDGLLYVTGSTFSSEFRYQTYTRQVTSSTAYVMKIDTDGNFYGAYFGEPQDDISTQIGSDTYAYQSVVNGNGDIYTAGGFWEGVVWGCVSATTSDYGLFLVKHIEAGSPVRMVSGPGTMCATGGSVTLSTDLISNGVLYRWFTPSGADPAPGTILKNSINITPNASYDGEIVIVSIQDNCDTYFATPYVFNIPPTPTEPVLTASKDVVCPETTAGFEIITSESNTYTWDLPAGVTAPGLTEEGGTLIFSSTFAGGDVRITSSNVCGSAEKLFHVGIHPSPDVPNLTGDLVICPGIVQIQRSINTVPHATSYLWELPPFVSFDPLYPNNGLTLRAVVVGGLVTGEVRVRAVGICKTSDASAPITISRIANPQPASSITGVNELCIGDQPVRYSVPPILHATKYSWSIPEAFNKAGTVVTHEPFVDLIAVDGGEGEIAVRGKNDCQQEGEPSAFAIKTHEPLASPVLTASACDFEITVSNAKDFSWYLNGIPAPHLSGSPITLADTGQYYVQVENFCGIKQSERLVAYPMAAAETLIPNIITPNGDGKNDHLQIDKSLSNANVAVVNRWGELVYSSPSFNNQWNADDLAVGTYYITVRHSCLPKGYRGWLSVMK